MDGCGNIERMGFAVDSDAINSELHAWCYFGQSGRSAFTAGQAVRENADLVAAIGLSVGEINNVTKNAPHRCADRVKNAKGLVR
jgi:hypothetical protein